MKKTVSFLLVVVLIMLPFTGCSFFDKSINIVYALSSVPKNIDPQTADSSDEFIVINSLFEGLYTIDESGNLVYAAAKNVEKSADGLLYSITLRDDILWSNNKKVTAYDFEFAFKRLLSPETESKGASKFFCIKNASKVNNGSIRPEDLGVKALSDTKLSIELEYAKNDFEYLLSSTYAMPCNEEFFNSTKGRYGLDGYTILANGPFDMYSWRDNDSIRLTKNEYYYNKKEVIPDVVKLLLTKIDDEIEALKNEEVDAAFVDGSRYSEITNKGYSTEKIESGVWGIGLNFKNEYLKNKDIRNAIAYCFDKSLYKDSLTDNLQTASTIIPHGVCVNGEVYRDKVTGISGADFEIAKAKQHLSKGLKSLNKSKMAPLNLLVCKNDNIDFLDYFSGPSQIFQKELALYINVTEVGENEYYQKLASGDFDLVIYKFESQDNTPYSILSSFKSDSNDNYLNYKNETYDSLLQSSLSAMDSTSIIELYKQLESTVLNDVAFIPMFFSTDYFVQAKGVTGIQYIPANGSLSFKHATK